MLGGILGDGRAAHRTPRADSGEDVRDKAPAGALDYNDPGLTAPTERVNHSRVSGEEEGVVNLSAEIGQNLLLRTLYIVKTKFCVQG